MQLDTSNLNRNDDGDFVNTLILRECGASYRSVPMQLMILDCISWARQVASWHELHARRREAQPHDLNVLLSYRLADELKAWANCGGMGSIAHPFLVERIKMGPPVITRGSIEAYAAKLIKRCAAIPPTAPLDAISFIDDDISSLVTSSPVLFENCGLYIEGHLVPHGGVDSFAKEFWNRVADSAAEMKRKE